MFEKRIRTHKRKTNKKKKTVSSTIFYTTNSKKCPFFYNIIGNRYVFINLKHAKTMCRHEWKNRSCFGQYVIETIFRKHGVCYSVHIKLILKENFSFFPKNGISFSLCCYVRQWPILQFRSDLLWNFTILRAKEFLVLLSLNTMCLRIDKSEVYTCSYICMYVMWFCDFSVLPFFTLIFVFYTIYEWRLNFLFYLFFFLFSWVHIFSSQLAYIFHNESNELKKKTL